MPEKGINARPRERQRVGTRKNPRARLACLRCQRRKIRCDGELPSCQNCRTAGVDCADGESTRLKNLPRAYIVSLKERIQWLESIVKEQCPDVDLGHGPPLQDDSMHHFSEPAEDTEAGLHTPATFNDITDSPDHANPADPANIIPSAATHRLRPVLGGSNALSHEIGLVSLGASQDPRYIGPSSGYFLARVMLTKQIDETNTGVESTFPCELVESVQGPLPLPERRLADQLCNAYFDAVHFQYPILHRPSFVKMLDLAYEPQSSPDSVAIFQINMVLAIGATITSSRTRARLPAESYCLSALVHFHKLNIENSLQGLQCLVLLLVFAMHSPYMRLNVWYLNYQCIAALLDLGLQRDMSDRSPGWSLLEQEMRTRIFWVVFMLDRMIATMMGRPIGLRDEGCELRLPRILDESALTVIDPGLADGQPSPVAYSIHLFRLAKLNSEIKYVANSVNRETPRYAYPTIINIIDWQQGMLQQLDQWAAEIPGSGVSGSGSHYITLLCRLRGHSIRMLLLRPSPAIPKPSATALEGCYNSAIESIRIFDELYRKDLLVYTWTAFHSLVLSTLTMLYCIRASPGQNVAIDAVMADLSMGLSVLSATGEHWSGAKRCRDILDDLGRSTIRWMMESQSGQPRTNHNVMSTRTVTPPSRLPLTIPAHNNVPQEIMGSTNGILDTVSPFDDLLIGGNAYTEYLEPSDFVDMDMIMKDLFQDFIPTGSQFP